MKQNVRRALVAELLMRLVAMILLLLPSGLGNAQRMALAAEAAPLTSRAPASKVLVTGVRSTSSDGYARITVELSQDSKFEVRRLVEGKGTSPRVYVDIFGAQLALGSTRAVAV
ncbi:MAG TPA: hypothetical protein VFY96_10910, partial [Candidatus Binatia bacterium]|nr:hypothetical protein [Candidatus Binatia bacterium]